MSRIFLSLAVIANSGLWLSLWYGLSIDAGAADMEATRRSVSMHLLTALGASLLVLMMHAVVLTYFMGTGRWIEETSAAYRLPEELHRRSIRLKYRAIPGLVLCFVLVIVTGAVGAQADPLARAGNEWIATAHFTLAVLTVLVNLGVSMLEYGAIRTNGGLIAQVVAEVRRIRAERGLP
ncbi:MAG: hypothetical protein KF774_07410 [Planctomyces sp.]|nr:hypothetical protein [Planctomyces sp.]